MSVTFDNIPSNIRTPGQYIEINNELAGIGSIEFQLLVLGQRLATGTVPAAQPILVSGAAQADEFFGRGSQLANMLNYIFAAKPAMTVRAIALDDAVGGVSATGTITFTGAASTAGSLAVYVGGERVRAAIAEADSQDAIASAVVSAINAQTDFPVTAAVNGGTANQVDLTARNDGENGNYLSIEVLFESASQPTSPAIAVVDMAGGAGNPDIADAITVMGDEWYNWIVCPWTDAPNLSALNLELLDRWGPLRQIAGRTFIAYRETLANTATFGNGLNSHLITCMGTNMAPQPPHIWAAVNAVVAGNALMIDPARPLQTLLLPGIKPAASALQWVRAERNTLLFDGIATHEIDQAGGVHIERQITTYQTNGASVADASYLDINTPETLDRFRFRQRSLIALRYPNHKLASDGAQYGVGQAIVTPSIIRGQLLALYRDLMSLGWVEDYESYESSLVVERDSDGGGTDPNRINVLDHPNLVNQFRVYAGKVQFIV